MYSTIAGLKPGIQCAPWLQVLEEPRRTVDCSARSESTLAHPVRAENLLTEVTLIDSPQLDVAMKSPSNDSVSRGVEAAHG